MKKVLTLCMLFVTVFSTVLMAAIHVGLFHKANKKI